MTLHPQRLQQELESLDVIEAGLLEEPVDDCRAFSALVHARRTVVVNSVVDQVQLRIFLSGRGVDTELGQGHSV